MDVVALQDRIRLKSHSPPLDFRQAGGMALELVFRGGARSWEGLF